MSLSSILKPNSLHIFGAELTPGPDSTKYLYYDAINDALAISVNGIEVQYNTGGSTVVITLISGTGSAPTPSYSFAGHTDSGMYYDTGTSTIAFSLNGAKVFDINSGGVSQSKYLAGDGSVVSPSFSFTNHQDVGLLYHASDNGLGIAVSGVEVQFNTSSHTELIRTLAQVGDSADPAYSFIGYAESGMYYTIADTAINMSISNANVLKIKSDRTQGPAYEANDGSFSLPGYGFKDHPGTGHFYDPINSSIATVVNGTIMKYESASTTQVLNGSNAAPSYSFELVPSTGMYYDSIGTALGFSNGGTTILALDSSKANATRVIVDNGTNTAPGFSFQGEQSTGLYYDPINSAMVSSIAGTNIRYDKAGGTYMLNGASANPSYSFASFQTSGMFFDPVNTAIGFSNGGVELMDIKDSGIRLFNNQTGYNASILNAYTELASTSVTLSYTGGSTTTNYEGVLVGKMCTISIEGYSVTLGVLSSIVSTTINERFRPTMNLNTYIKDNTGGDILVIVNTSGNLSWQGPTGDLPAATYIFPNISLTYRCQ